METIGCELCKSEHSRPVLHSRDLLLSKTDEQFSIVCCAHCGFLYLNPRPTPEEIGRYYPDQYYDVATPQPRSRVEQSVRRASRSIKRWVMEDFYGYPSRMPVGWWQPLRKAVLWPEKTLREVRGRTILPWVGQGRLLDVGCGPGVNLETLQGLGWDVYGVEFSEAAAAHARARVGDRVQTGTLETARFPDEYFDVILFSHSLEHLFHPLDALSRVRRWLASNGRLIIAVPNAASFEAWLFGEWWVQWDPPRHLYHFTRVTLTALLNRAGYRIERITTGVGHFFFLVSLERWWTCGSEGSLPARWLIERFVARPACLIAGHLGYGTELTVYAKKDSN